MSIQLKTVKVVGDYGSSVEGHPYVGYADADTTSVSLQDSDGSDHESDTDHSVHGYDVVTSKGLSNEGFVGDKDGHVTTNIDDVNSDAVREEQIVVKVVDGLDDKQMPGWNGTKPPAYYPGEDSSDPNWTLQKSDQSAVILLDEASLHSDNSSPSLSKKGCWNKSITQIQGASSDFFSEHGKTIKRSIYVLMLIAYGGYFAWSLYYEFGTESSIRLLWMTMVGVALVIITLIRDNFGDWIYDKILMPPVGFINRHFTVCKWLFIGCAVAGIIIFLAIAVGTKTPYNLISLAGFVTFILLLFLFSHNPAKVKWRPVLWGLGLQFIFALLVLRTVAGYEAFKWLGDRVQEFLEYSDAGAAFVFGENFEEHFFAFKVLPIVIFFSATISVLYYLGIMQTVISKIAWVMQSIMGTTAAESVNAAGNIFIGQTEAPLLIRPMIADMTSSELHAVMVGGYATIAGSVMATYISIGVSANHLITASVMAAPCALAMSKLFYPETQKSKTTAADVAKMEKSPQRNVIEAASAGASAAISLVANIAVNLMAFISLLEFLNTVLTWMGHRAGMWPPEYPELTFELICSYLFWPFAFLMGVAQDDCRQVAELIGVKTFINEFVAYTQLSVIIENSETFESYNGSYVYVLDDIYLQDANVTLVGGVMEDRSITIATYALCGFANIGSLGTVMGALGAMVPTRKAEIANLAMRALVAGTVVSFMNACVAGLLYEESLAQ